MNKAKPPLVRITGYVSAADKRLWDRELRRVRKLLARPPRKKP